MREKKSNKLKETKEKYNHINARGGFFFFLVILRMVNNLLHKFYKLLFTNNPKKKI